MGIFIYREELLPVMAIRNPAFVMTQITEPLLLTAFPNPFTNSFKVTAQASQNETASFTIYNIYGQAIDRITASLQTGTNEIEIRTEDYPSGLYYLHYKTEFSKLFI